MKKLFLFTALCAMCAGLLSAQDIKSVRSAAYYGVDFSQTKVFAAQESDGQFTEIFESINYLILKEHKKYNLGKAFGKMFPVKDIEKAVSRKEMARENDLRTTNQLYRVSDQQVKEIVSAYASKSAEQEVGLLIICELLNKQDNQGVWKAVFFNTATGEIIYSKTAVGKAKGFGLRNFWAGSLYQVLKKWKY